MQKVVLIALLALAACSRDTAVYPSLAERPTEKRGFAEPETPAPEPVGADPALEKTVAALTTRLTAVGKGFDADAARAERAAGAARGRPVGSDPWLTAQTALAALDDWRAQASSLASDAGELASARAAALVAPYPALEAVQAALAAEVAREEATIDRIQASVPAA